MHTRRWCSVLLVALCIVAPVSAELKYTSKLTMKTVTGGPQPEGLFAMMAGQMAPMIEQIFGGPEGVEIVNTMHEDGRMRMDYVKSFAGLPAGAVVLTKPDGTSVGYDAKAGTWWKMSDPASAGGPEMAAMMAQMKPEFSFKKMGTRETIAGMPTEQTRMNMRMPIPLPPGMEQVPPELAAMIPKEITVEADMWQTPQFAKYSKSALQVLSSGVMAQFGLDKLGPEAFSGFTMKMTMRMSVMPGYEMEMLVSKVGEASAPAGTFDLPTGLKEVPMPQPSIR